MKGKKKNSQNSAKTAKTKSAVKKQSVKISSESSDESYQISVVVDVPKRESTWEL